MHEQPRGWGNDELSQFLSAAHTNTFATFQRMPQYYSRLSEINDLLSRSLESTNNSGKPVSSQLLLRAHASYLAAVRLGLATQTCESFMAQRGALEAALYGELVSNCPGAAEKWLTRHDSEAALGEMKREFRIGPMLDDLGKRDPRVGVAVRALYGITIDWGAHPNPYGVMGTMELEGDDKRFHIELQYLTAKTEQIELALKSTARVGVAVLELFRLVFPKRFELADLEKEIRRVSKGL